MLLVQHQLHLPGNPISEAMDAQYPFASRDDIWRVFDELKELHAAQFEQGERIARLERRRDEDARLRSVWGPLSPFPSSVGAPIPTGMQPWFLISSWLTIWLLQNPPTALPQTPSRDSIKVSTTPWPVLLASMARKSPGGVPRERIVFGLMRVPTTDTTDKQVGLALSFRSGLVADWGAIR